MSTWSHPNIDRLWLTIGLEGHPGTRRGHSLDSPDLQKVFRGHDHTGLLAFTLPDFYSGDRSLEGVLVFERRGYDVTSVGVEIVLLCCAMEELIIL